MIKGNMPNQDYDLKFAFLIEDEDGNKKSLKNIPEGRNYDVTISCNNGASGVWDYINWGPKIQNLTITRTKCTLTFVPVKPSAILAREKIPLVTEGNGLYEVSHEDAEITYTTDTTIINHLKQTEYRYAGPNPDNYIRFKNELWRIIGLVNTLEGGRIKIIRNESIGAYSWDTTPSNINDGLGINEWSQLDFMNLLNRGVYYNRTSKNCYAGSKNVTTPCDFNDIGITSMAKTMIEEITWNTGSNGSISYDSIKTNAFYNLERSNNISKICNSSA